MTRAERGPDPCRVPGPRALPPASNTSWCEAAALRLRSSCDVRYAGDATNRNPIWIWPDVAVLERPVGLDQPRGGGSRASPDRFRRRRRCHTEVAC